MVVLLLSLVGVPPLAGFTGKLLLFGAALHGGFGWLTVLAILNSVVSLAVYLRIIVAMYQRTGAPAGPRPSRILDGLAAVAVVGTLVLGIGAEWVLGNLGTH
jgi:NADH-quinone oxidoreductase subunit N